MTRLGPNAFNNQFGPGPNKLKEINLMDGLSSTADSSGIDSRANFMHINHSKN